MSECSCIYVDVDGPAETIRKDVVKARKDHNCNECGCVIQKGKKYESYAGKFDNHFFQHKTCEDCLSIRNEFFCGGWSFEMLWYDLSDHIIEMCGEISSECLLNLTKTSRDKVCDLIEEYWLDSDDD